MSEEKPTFKVTDRRLFNPDGTPREGVERDEPTPAPSPSAATTTPRAEAPAREEAHEATPQPSGGTRTTPTQEPAAPPRAESDAGEAREEEEGEQEFLMAVEFIASFAAEALGMAAHPGAVSAPPQVNLPLARQCIDMLGALQRKTSGNLNDEEQHFLELILSQLRMQYVKLTQRPRPAGGPAPKGGPHGSGFTGGDITGGR